MSQEKAQLIAPQGHFTVPGLNVAGVVTASSFSGNCTGTASSLTQGSNVVVGVMTASSFAGDVFGNAAGLSTTTAGLKLGIVTSTSFAGNFTGIGSGLTGTPNIVAGLVTASQFIGNTPGLAAGLSAGKNLAAGIITATTFHGDGSGLTGAGSTAYIRQTVRATDSTTTINLNDGNIIYYEGAADTTISIANTSTADDVTIVRSLASTFSEAYNESFSTGGVTFDGTGDYLSMADNAAFQLGTGDWTMECFWKSGSGNTGNYQQLFGTQAVFAANDGIWRVGTRTNSNQIYFSRADGSGFEEPVWNINVNDEAWHHIAFTRASGYVYCWVDGVEQTNVGESNNITATMTTSNAFWVGYNGRDGTYNTGTVSSLRIVKGTAVYTTGTNFLPPSAALTNVTNTVLLCCQSDSSTTAATVSAGTITANGDPAAGAQTVAYSGTNTLNLSTSITWPSSITWNGGTAPTLLGANSYSFSGQVFNLVTADGGTTWYGYEEVNNTNWTSSGALYTWGSNTNGVLGQNNTTNDYSVGGSQVGSDSSWTNLSGSFYTALGTKNDGTLWTWGKNEYGSQGLNDEVSRSSPTQIGSGTDWKYAADNYGAGGRHNAAVKTDGTLWAWGINSMGALGQNTTTTVSSPVQIPGTTWESVATNYSYYMLSLIHI